MNGRGDGKLPVAPDGNFPCSHVRVCAGGRRRMSAKEVVAGSWFISKIRKSAMARSLSRLGHCGMLPEAIERVAENEQRAKMRVEERLDAELVPRAKQALLPRVPDGKGEIAEQMFDAGSPQASYAWRIN